jgi:hypothetical protein
MMRAMPSLARRSPCSGAPRVLVASLRSLLLGVLVAVSAVSSTARAAEPIVGLRSLAMGDTLRAAATEAEGPLLNPSGMAVTQKFQVSGLYSLRLPSLGHFVHLSVVDSVTNRHIAIGLYYSFTQELPRYAFPLAEGPYSDGTAQRVILVDGARISRNGNESGVSAAVPIGDRLSLGATVKYAYYALRAELESSMIPSGYNFQLSRLDKERGVDLGSIGHIVTFDFGITLRLIDQLRIGIVGQNLWPQGHELPIRLGLGLAYRLGERLLLAGDAVINFTGSEDCVTIELDRCTETTRRTTTRFGLGAEYSILGRVPIRAGYTYDNTMGTQAVTGGIGYMHPSPSFALDFGFRQRVDNGSETVLLLGFRVIRD